MNACRVIRWLTSLIGVILLVGCSNYKDKSFEVLVIDDLNILSFGTKQWLKAYHYPKGFAFVIRTVRTIDPGIIGVSADELFLTTLAQHPQERAFAARGVLVVVSQNPALVQVRVGEELYTLARWGGVTAGLRYVENQLLAARGNLNYATRKMIVSISSDLPVVTTLSWYKRLILLDVLQSLHAELDELSLPSEGFYGHYILKPTIALRVLERKLVGSWWITFVVVAIFFLLIKKLLLGAIVNVLDRYARPAVAATVRVVLALCIGLLLAIPSAGSAILLSGSRLEDQIALKDTGLPGVATLAFQPELFNESTGMWLALLLVGMRVTKGFADRGWMAGLAFLPDAQQNARFSRLQDNHSVLAFLVEAMGTRPGKIMDVSKEHFLLSPFFYAYFQPVVDDTVAGIRWGLLAFLFLPLPLSLAAVYFWTVPVVMGIYETGKSFKQTNSPTNMPPVKRPPVTTKGRR